MAKRRIDNVGRITIPKNIRDEFGINENDEFEFSTKMIDGKMHICLFKENLGNNKIQDMIETMKAMGVTVPEELLN